MPIRYLIGASSFGFGMTALALSATLGVSQLASAQAQAQTVSATSRELATAQRLAERSGFDSLYQLQCHPDGNLPAGLLDPSVPPATKLFDNFYFVGMASVGAYALKTSDGIILFDSLNNPHDASSVIVPGLKAMGLDPADIKYVVLSHGHSDHYGGAQWLRDTYGARVIASEADWQMMGRPPVPGGRVPPPGRGAPPTRDMVAVDGQKLTLGDTSVTLVLTPGHTPGTLSFLIPVKDQGKPHMLAMWGGTGLPADPAAVSQYISSVDRFAAVARRMKADVELSNHPFVDNSLNRMVQLRANPAMPNPFVIGRAKYADYEMIIKHCAVARQSAKVASVKP